MTLNKKDIMVEVVLVHTYSEMEKSIYVRILQKCILTFGVLASLRCLISPKTIFEKILDS